MLEILNLSLSNIIFYAIWLVSEIWVINKIVKSRFVKSNKERVLWIVLVVVSWFIGVLIFFFVTNQRQREKYSRK
jgi:hypothetical protein